MKNNHNKIKNLITHLRESSDTIYTIFTQGSCFKLYLILNEAFENCVPLWSDLDDHCIIQIDNKFYDIGGEVKEEYIEHKGYYIVPQDQISGYSLLKSTETDFTKNNRTVVTQKYK